MTAPTTSFVPATFTRIEAPKPCEYPDHDLNHVGGGHAEWQVLRLCPACHRPRVMLLCDVGKEKLSADGVVECADCGEVDYWSEFVLYVERI